MFENDSDILYYVVEIDSKTYSLFNRNTDSLILSDVNFDQIKKFLLKNNPIHPALGPDRSSSKVPGSSPVIIPTKISNYQDKSLCAIQPKRAKDKFLIKKEYKKRYKATPPKPIPPPDKEDCNTTNYPSGSD
jgi:hypothetical protein